MISCAHCQAELRDSSFFCKKCGKEVYVCIRCGKTGIGGRCIHDGRPLITAQVRASDSPLPPASLADLMRELDSLVGLASVKRQLHHVIESLNIKIEAAATRGYRSMPVAHFVFKGNPGTGRSTVARLLAKILQSIGLLYKGHLVEVDHGDLVGQYIGQTAPKTTAVIDRAMGGVLLVDEAYALNSHHYGQEAIETLLIRMENDLGRFAVVLSGYAEEMTRFIDSVPIFGRVSTIIEFDDYTPEEMAQIF